MTHELSRSMPAHEPVPPDHPDTPTAPHNAWQYALRLVAASEAYLAQLRGAMRLSANEMNALMLLHHGGDCSMTELSQGIQLSRPACTTLVDRLMEEGWVRRYEDPHDRRRVLVVVTDRFTDEFVQHSHGWRQRLQNHASETGADWVTVVEHLEALCSINRRSALTILDEPDATASASLR
jgi:DNA-binding MarR family transcriptional regulator